MSISENLIGSKCEPVHVVSYNLKLTQRSAELLMSLMQNPLSDDEDNEITKFRENVFTSLRNAGVQHG